MIVQVTHKLSRTKVWTFQRVCFTRECVTVMGTASAWNSLQCSLKEWTDCHGICSACVSSQICHHWQSCQMLTTPRLQRKLQLLPYSGKRSAKLNKERAIFLALEDAPTRN